MFSFSKLGRAEGQRPSGVAATRTPRTPRQRSAGGQGPAWASREASPQGAEPRQGPVRPRGGTRPGSGPCASP